jgi:hypothetical protein
MVSSTINANRAPTHTIPLPVAHVRQRDEIADLVLSALDALDPCRKAGERRRETRYPYPYPIHITPFTADGQANVDQTFVVIGKHLAPHGVDFYSREPLADRRVIASLYAGEQGWIGLVVELAWCRFGRHGWYDNGGRFVALVPSPVAEPGDRPTAA